MYQLCVFCAVLRAVGAVQVSGITAAGYTAYNDIYSPKGSANGRPYYLGYSSAKVLYFANTAALPGQWCLSTDRTTCLGSLADKALSADAIASKTLTIGGTSKTITIAAYGGSLPPPASSSPSSLFFFSVVFAELSGTATYLPTDRGR